VCRLGSVRIEGGKCLIGGRTWSSRRLWATCSSIGRCYDRALGRANEAILIRTNCCLKAVASGRQRRQQQRRRPPQQFAAGTDRTTIRRHCIRGVEKIRSVRMAQASWTQASLHPQPIHHRLLPNPYRLLPYPNRRRDVTRPPSGD
jgi:hypothetical protein